MTTEIINAVSSGFSGIQENILSSLGVVVPIALAVFAILFLWIFAVNFFKKISGAKESKIDSEDEEDDDD